MRVRCVTEEPSHAQVVALGRLYAGPKQSFGVARGMEYLVFALSVLDGVTYVDVEQEFEQVVAVPLFLFEIIDPRLSSIWEVKQRADGSLLLWPPVFHARQSYAEDILDGDPTALIEFRDLRHRLENSNGDA